LTVFPFLAAYASSFYFLYNRSEKYNKRITDLFDRNITKDVFIVGLPFSRQLEQLLSKLRGF